MFIIGGKVRSIHGLSVLFSLFFCTPESIVKRQSLFPGEKSRFLRPAQKDSHVRALKQTTLMILISLVHNDIWRKKALV